MDKWTLRRTSCDTVHTHPDITNQVVVDHRTAEIKWNEKLFDSVKEAKVYAESTSLPQA